MIGIPLRYDPLRSSKVIDFYVNWKPTSLSPTCDFLLLINSNLGPVWHRLAAKHLWQTDGRTSDNADNCANSSFLLPYWQTAIGA